MKRNQADLVTAQTAIQALQKKARPEKVDQAQRYFKCGPGEYGEGDRFLAVPVPETRKIARQHQSLTHEQLQILLKSPIHEMRLLALIILSEKSRKAARANDFRTLELNAKFYLKNLKHINNWDLVDTSAEHVLGQYYQCLPHAEILRRLQKHALSRHLWEKRISLLTCFCFIRKCNFKPLLTVAVLLINDEHDLIHKALGWMLREVGKRDLPVEIAFLEKHAHRLPRSALRYAIEKFPPQQRRKWLQVERVN